MDEKKTENKPEATKRSHSKKPESKPEVKQEQKPELKPTGDGKVTMKKNGVGRRFAETRIKELEKDGWELVK